MDVVLICYAANIINNHLSY